MIKQQIIAKVLVILMLLLPSSTAFTQSPLFNQQANTERVKSFDFDDEFINAILQKDLNKAKTAFKRLKEAGKRLGPYIARATNLADRLYDEGKYDYSEAWFRFAAEEGGASAQVSIGISLLEKKNGMQSDLEALRWFRLAEQRNDPWALAGLAQMYEEGRGGLTKSREKAKEYYKLAADSGITFAGRKLSDLWRETEAENDSVYKAIQDKDIESVKKIKEIEATDKEGNTALLVAVKAKSNEMVRHLLSMGAKPNVTNLEGETPLVLAVDDNEVNITEALLNAGADPNMADSQGRLPLHSALAYGNSEILQMLLKAKVDVYKKGLGGLTAVHYAIIGLFPDGIASDSSLMIGELLGIQEKSPPSGGIERLVTILKAGADPNVAGEEEMTPLMLAVNLAGRAASMESPEASELIKALNILVENGANPNFITKNGNTPLMFAALADCHDCINPLIKYGARVDAQDKDKRTALSFAFQTSNPLVTLELIKSGANVFIEDVYGLSPISYGVWYSKLGQLSTKRQIELNDDYPPLIVQTFNKLKAFEQRKDVRLAIVKERSRIELFQSAGLGDLTRVRALLATGISFDKKNPEGITPLFFAINSGRVEVVKFLLKSGANIEIAKQIDISPLMLAAQSCNAEIVKALIAAKADVNQINKEGKSALHYSILNQKKLDKPLLESFHLQEGIINQQIGLSNLGLIRDARLKENFTQLQYEIIAKQLSLSSDNEQNDALFSSGVNSSNLISDGFTGQCVNVVDILVSSGANIEAKDNNGVTPFQLACNAKLWDIVKYFIQAKNRLNSTTCGLLNAITQGTFDDVRTILNSPKGNTLKDDSPLEAIRLSIMLKRADVLALLLQSGFDVNTRGSDGSTPLMIASVAGNLESVRLLITNGAKPNQFAVYGGEWNKNEGTPLNFAVDNKSYDLAKTLLELGANVNFFNRRSETPLMNASKRLDIQMVQLLLEQGADITAKDKDKATALGYAVGSSINKSEAQTERLRLFSILLEEGDNVDTRNVFWQETPLTAVAGQGDTKAFELFLKAGADVNATSRYGKTPLIAAAESGNIEIVKKLLERGAKLEAEMNRPSGFDVPGTALIRAIAEHKYNVALELIKAGANVNFENSAGRTPLMLAAINGNIELTAALIKAGANVKENITIEESPHFLAAEFNHDKVLELLLDAGAPVNETDDDENTILFYVINQNSYDKNDRILNCIRLLVSRGVSINAENNDNETVLLKAAKKGLMRTSSLLIELGASLSAADSQGQNALLRVVSGAEYYSDDRAQLIRFLINKGMNINDVDFEGNTGLMFAASEGNVELTQLLLQLGADTNKQSATGETALHKVLNTEQEIDSDEQAKITTLLINNKANVNIAATDGSTPLMKAVFSGATKAIPSLLKAGAKVNTQNKNGYTSLMYAAAQGRIDIIKLLLQAGAVSSHRTKDGLDARTLALKNGYKEVAELLAKRR